MPDAGRVIGGSARGIRLLAPGEGTRPLTDRVKESLFAALESAGVVGPGRVFLDLFAGSGAAGIEALSRGCSRAVLVEHDAGACRVIEQNLARAHVAGGTVRRADVARFLAGGPQAGGAPFDAVLVDPPFASEALEPALRALSTAGHGAVAASGWLNPEAIVVARHFWRRALPAQIGVVQRYRERRFGETMVTFYRISAGQGTEA